jgi:hypothetical protein
MTTDGGQPGRPDGVVLGLLTDPDLPAELAEQLAGELPELLAERLGDQVSCGSLSSARASTSTTRAGSCRSPTRAGPGKAGTWWSA